ncbi:antitoxin Xre/MbcA/ParS toxin-binding domain-containing protein [Hydrogenophaga taeniospiralis]|uniref:antitoxin Xre/MbcA/ParS toxin-binding domain-containing protein n=1 Tax=Hydrogenophaga taeniospiralis TaxID=65656 RepID=UPI001CFBF545|nr:antitoxin Xre/MbcA/ParS toxin-binding domain-containing protein [Hydrogenophaga taeniospiralis]
MMSINLDEAKMTNLSEKTAPAKASAMRRAVQPATAAAVARKSGRAGEADVIVYQQGAGHSKTSEESVVKRVKVNMAPGKGRSITYVHAKGVDAFVTRVAKATPMEIVEVERHGIDSIFLKDLSKYMDVPAVRIFDIVGIPKATAEKKVAAKALIAGAGGQAALGLARLLAIAKGIVENSTAAEAKGFDVAKWLGHWIERPQPALGGRKPADLIGTPTGLDMVTRVLGAVESGAYQ